MTTPSARPPSSARRFESLDTEAARRFISGGAGGEGQGTPEAAPLPPASVQASEPPPPPRRELMKVLTVRLPESLHARLDFIARNSPHSMNSFVQAALEPAIAAEIEKINKRKAMGLD
jgi:hypothetical protein